MSADKFHVRHEVGRSYVQRVAAFRPFIAFFLVLAFAAGFSERLVKEVLRTTDGSEKPAPTPPAPTNGAGAPAPAPPGE